HWRMRWASRERKRPELRLAQSANSRRKIQSANSGRLRSRLARRKMQEKKRRQIEREFGVPIAGEILDPSQWTQTALKRLPAQGRLAWEELFGRTAPLVLDLGCGNGRFLLQSAVWRPDHDHVGVHILPLVIRYATRRGNQ